MILEIEQTNAAELRLRVSQLRHEIEATTQACRIAKEEGQPIQLASLLRQRSDLITRLIQRQRELLDCLSVVSAG